MLFTAPVSGECISVNMMRYKNCAIIYKSSTIQGLYLFHVWAISWVTFSVLNRAKWYTKLAPCCYAQVCQTNNKHLTKMTFTKQNHCSRQNM